MDNRRQRIQFTLGSIAPTSLLLALFFVAWLFPFGQRASSTEASPLDGAVAQAEAGLPVGERPRIVMRGTGIVSARPDILNLQAGVSIQNASLADAQWEAATEIDAALTRLRELGVEERDIATSQYNVEPVYEYPRDQPPRRVGFRVTHSLNVRIRDVGNAGKTIDDLVKTGVTNINGISFSFSDPSALVKQARELAMNDAKSKAQQVASLSGVTLGPPLLIEDAGSNVQQRPTGFFSPVESAEPPRTAISPGEQEVRIQVSVVYSIK